MKNAKAPKPVDPPRLLPAMMVTIGVLLGLKAVAFAESAAETAAGPAATPQTAAQTPAPAAGQAASAAQPVSCSSDSFAAAAGLSPGEVQVLQSLGARRTALDARAVEMDTRQELLAATERRIEERLAELKRIEARLQQTTTTLDDAQTQRITSLVDVYQRMRAKDAAAVFDQLDEDVLVDVASRMRQANLAEIMGKMNPTRARELTRLLARARGPDVASIAQPAPPAGQTKR